MDEANKQSRDDNNNNNNKQSPSVLNGMTRRSGRRASSLDHLSSSSDDESMLTHYNQLGLVNKGKVRARMYVCACVRCCSIVLRVSIQCV